MTSGGNGEFSWVTPRYRHFLAKKEKSEIQKRKPLRIKGRNRELRSNHGRLRQNFTYYTSAKGFFMGCSLQVEMTWPDSINDVDIETFSMIRKPKRKHIRLHQPGISRRGTPWSNRSTNRVSCLRRVFSPRPNVPGGRRPGESPGQVARRHPRSHSHPHFLRPFAERRCGRPSPDTGSGP